MEQGGADPTADQSPPHPRTSRASSTPPPASHLPPNMGKSEVGLHTPLPLRPAHSVPIWSLHQQAPSDGVSFSSCSFQAPFLWPSLGVYGHLCYIENPLKTSFKTEVVLLQAWYVRPPTTSC